VGNHKLAKQKKKSKNFSLKIKKKVKNLGFCLNHGFFFDKLKILLEIIGLF
jgi:hypothetical protein